MMLQLEADNTEVIFLCDLVANLNQSINLLLDDADVYVKVEDSVHQKKKIVFSLHILVSVLIYSTQSNFMSLLG